MGAIEQLFWAEVDNTKATTRSLAVCYALLIAVGAGRGGDFWSPINKAVNERLGLDHIRKIDRFRKVAWDIHDAAANRAALAAVREGQPK